MIIPINGIIFVAGNTNVIEIIIDRESSNKKLPILPRIVHRVVVAFVHVCIISGPLVRNVSLIVIYIVYIHIYVYTCIGVSV